jgi:hypothetical protein
MNEGNKEFGFGAEKKEIGQDRKEMEPPMLPSLTR